ncbi:MAG: acyloxyacyl hydrolase [Bdellovibrionales bacterium]|jgi:opacity protein-like surface antigen|nr:acyloxyacyl hydrolase [Bdellovibrionales bacterium]
MKSVNIEGLDGVTSRVVTAALKERRVEDEVKVDNVTDTEMVGSTRRIKTTRQWKFGLGPAWGRAMNVEQSGIQYTLGFVWGMDPQWDLDISLRIADFEKARETGAHFSEFMIGTNYHFTREKHTPFFTAGVGRGTASASSNSSIMFSDDRATGWMLRTGVGYKFFRTSTVNAAIEANHSFLLASTSRTEANPGLTSLTLALYY